MQSGTHSALVPDATPTDTARAHRVAARHLWEDGIVDDVVPEPDGGRADAV